MLNETCAVLSHELRRFNNLSWAGLFASAFVLTTAQAALPVLQPAVLTRSAPSISVATDPARPAPLPLQSAPAPVVQPISFTDPTPGYGVNSPFGLRRLPWEPHGRLHAGADFAAPYGSKIVATAEGVVTRAGYNGSYGNFVEIRHPEGLTSFYAHMMRRASVRPGQQVGQGQVIGRVGSTGSSTGAHLHFEMRDARDRVLNPASFVGQSFADASELPIRAAARIPGRVRIAQISGGWPPRALARLRGQDSAATLTRNGRVHARFGGGMGAYQPSGPLPLATPKTAPAGPAAQQPLFAPLGTETAA
ncbi:MAG: M23 family metallopeptidase [Caulobacteraceae bacterium]